MKNKTKTVKNRNWKLRWRRLIIKIKNERRKIRRKEECGMKTKNEGLKGLKIRR